MLKKRTPEIWPCFSLRLCVPAWCMSSGRCVGTCVGLKNALQTVIMGLSHISPAPAVAHESLIEQQCPEGDLMSCCGEPPLLQCSFYTIGWQASNICIFFSRLNINLRILSAGFACCLCIEMPPELSTEQPPASSPG